MKKLRMALINTLLICRSCGKEFLRRKYTYKASALAYTTLLSIVPLISVFVYLSKPFPIFSDIADQTREYIIKNFTPQTNEAVISYLSKFALQATKMPVMGIVFLFISAVLMIYTIENSINDIWNSPRKRNTKDMLIDGILILTIPFLIFASELLSTYLIYFYNNITFIKVLKLIAPIVVNSIMFAILYYAVPKEKINWLDALAGGVIAAILFSLAKFGFSVYISQNSSYTLIYGVLASIPIFLIWLYIFWAIILYGAIVVHRRFQMR